MGDSGAGETGGKLPPAAAAARHLFLRHFQLMLGCGSATEGPGTLWPLTTTAGFRCAGLEALCQTGLPHDRSRGKRAPLTAVHTGQLCTRPRPDPLGRCNSDRAASCIALCRRGVDGLMLAHCHASPISDCDSSVKVYGPHRPFLIATAPSLHSEDGRSACARHATWQ